MELGTVIIRFQREVNKINYTVMMKRNVYYNILLTVSNLFFPLLTFPYLSRVLQPDGFGAANFMTSFCQNFIVFSALGLPIYGVREIARNVDNIHRRSTIYFELLICNLFLTLVFIAVFLGIAYFHPAFEDLKELILVGALLIGASSFASEWFFIGLSHFKYVAIRSVLIRLASTIAIFILIQEASDFKLYFVITVGQVVLTSIYNFIQISRVTTRTKIQMTSIVMHFKPMAVLGIYIVLTSVYTILPYTLLGLQSSKSAVGYFSIADKIVQIVISLFAAVSAVLVSRLNATANEFQFVKLISKSLSIVVNLAFPLSFFILACSSSLVFVMAGEEFILSAQLVQVLAPTIILVSFAQVFCMQILSVFGKDVMMVMLGVVGMSISLAINLVFIDVKSYMAPGYAKLFSEIVVTTLALVLSWRCLTFPFPWKSLWLNGIGVVVFFGLHYLITIVINNHYFLLLCSGTVFVIFFSVYQVYVVKDRAIRVMLRSALSEFRFIESLKKKVATACL